MTRTHVEEGELVDLQRRALSLFTRLDNLENRVLNLKERGNSLRLSDLEVSNFERLASLAREVSDAVDALTDYVRNNR
jgi:hypothetical protein